MSDSDFRKIARKVVRLITTRDPARHAEIARS